MLWRKYGNALLSDVLELGCCGISSLGSLIITRFIITSQINQSVLLLGM